MATEQSIQDAVMVSLSQAGHRVYRSNAGTARAIDSERRIKLMPPGFPDLFGWRAGDGKFFAIEMKTPTGRLRPDQVKFKKFIETQPILYGVARSVEDAMKILEETK